MRVMTRLRQQDKAYATLQDALNSASQFASRLEEQVAKKGISAISDREWREHVLATRQQDARNGMRSALTEMGSTVSRYFTPEKSVVCGFAQTLRTPMSDADAREFAIPLSQAAGLADEEAAWRYELLMKAHAVIRQLVESAPRVRAASATATEIHGARHAIREIRSGFDRRFVRRKSRTRQTPIAPPVIPTTNFAYSRAWAPTTSAAQTKRRWFALLLKKDPQQLVQVAGPGRPGDSRPRILFWQMETRSWLDAVVTARSTSLPPVWRKSYTALVGLYFAETQPVINAAFTEHSRRSNHRRPDRQASRP